MRGTSNRTYTIGQSMSNNPKGTAKLSVKEVIALRKEYVELTQAINHFTQQYLTLGKRYGVSQDTVRKIVKNKTYKWVA